MKKTTLLKSMLLLCALIVGSGSLWAATVTDVIDNSATSSDLGNTGTTSWKSPDFSITGTSGAQYTIHSMGTQNTTNALQWNANGYLYATNSGGKVKSVTITTTANKSIGVYASNSAYDAAPTGSALTTLAATSSGAKYTFTSDYTYIALKGTASSTSITSVEIEWEVVTTDPTITFNTASVNVGKTLDVSTLFTSNSTGAVTYSITAGDSYATLVGTTLTGVAEGSVTIKAEQAAKGAYNAAEKSTTITVNPALTLSSIAITTPPTKTTYKEGQTFDPTGMVVTATYSDASTDDVTSLCTYSPSGALSTSDDKVTISYTENATTKTANQAITVSAQATDITITTNYEWLGVSSGTNLSSFPKVIENDGLTITIDGSGTKMRGDDTYVRFYSNNTMTFTAPDNHFIKSIVLTQSTESSTKWDNSLDADEGTWNNSTKTWSCGEDNIEEVTLTSDGQKWISQIDVTLVPYVNIIRAKTFTTFVPAKNLDFTSTDAMTAYIATAASGSAVTLTSVDKVPSGTPIVIKATTTGSAIPVLVSATTSSVDGNKLLAGDGTTEIGGNTKYDYILKNGLFCRVTTASALAAGKCYLHLDSAPTGANELTIDFENGNTTGIQTIESQKSLFEGDFYNLAGQKVQNPSKGLYIVNGKKVIIK